MTAGIPIELGESITQTACPEVAWSRLLPGPETIFEMDLKGTLTFVNQKSFEELRYSKEDFDAGLNVFHMVIEKDRVRAKENYKRIV